MAWDKASVRVGLMHVVEVKEGAIVCRLRSQSRDKLSARGQTFVPPMLGYI